MLCGCPPPPAIRRKKMGFVLPWEHWLRHELKSSISILTDKEALAAAGSTGAVAELEPFSGPLSGIR